MASMCVLVRLHGGPLDGQLVQALAADMTASLGVARMDAREMSCHA